MSYSNPIYNIAYKYVNKNTNVLYSPTNNTFDLLAELLDINLYHTNSSLQNYYYDLFWSNNFLEHTQQTKTLANNQHLIDMVWFHNGPPIKFKKEDIALVKNQLHDTIKIFSDIQTLKAWGCDIDEKNIIIQYGIPIFEDLDNISKTESILIMNPNNSQEINNLYQHIKNEFPTAQIINGLQHIDSISTLYGIISKYKVCIDIYNPMNVLISQYLGCKTITSTTHNPEIRGITLLFDYSNINKVLNSIINDELSKEDILHNQSWIQSNHGFNAFYNSVNTLLQKIKFEEFFVS
jgi:hypothetical protein